MRFSLKSLTKISTATVTRFASKNLLRTGFGALAALALVTAVNQPAAFAQRVVVSSQTGQGARYGDQNFEGEKINLNVVNADIRDILNYITEQYGVNFVIDKSVKEVPVTVNVSDVPWNVALNSILDANGLGIGINGSILRIADKQILANEDAVRKSIADQQLDASPLFTEFIRLNYARASGTLATQAGSTGVFTGGGTSGNSTGGDGANGGGILGIIKRRLSRRGGIETDERSNTLIVTDVRQNIDAVRQLIALLDQPEPQVEIEARIVIASRNFSRDLGVQLAAFGIGGNGAAGSLSTLPGSTTGGGTGTGAGTNGFRPGGIPGGIAGSTQPSGSLGANLANTVIGLTTGEIGSVQISALITAAEQKGQIKIVSTPRVSTLNNRAAQIESGSQIPVVTAQNGGGGGVAVFTTTFVSVPLRLSVTPQITDAGTVVLRVVAENNSVNRGLATNGTPGIDTQRMQTEVLVPDGGTTVVGGALIDNEAELRFRTPGLGSVPILGNLFKRRQTNRETSEILFFITPRIYRPDFAGNQTRGKVADSTRSTMISQPVPLGNPSSNSGSPTQQPLPNQTAPVFNNQNPAQPVVIQSAAPTTPGQTPPE